MTLIDQATNLIASFEGFRASPYQNPGDRPTIGYGTTYYDDGTPVTLQDPPLTQPQAWALLTSHVQGCLDRMETLVEVSLNQDQLTALASFDYNTGGLARSTLLILVNQGALEGARAQFGLWVHSGGRIDPGLVKRRAQEAELFLPEAS
jgi:lysozyme